MRPRAHGAGVAAAKRATDLPIFVKVGYGMDAAVGAAVSAGADGITAVNTVPGLDAGPPVRSGGLSGPPLLPMALWMVRRIASKYDVPVIGCGGVSTWRDAARHMDAGAAAVQVGTAAMNGLHVLGDVASGLAWWSVMRPNPNQP